MQLTAWSESFGPKWKVLEKIRAESQTLKFSKSVKYEPSYGCLKFKRGFEMLRSEMRENDFVKSSDFLHFAAHTFIWELWPKNKSCRGDPCEVTGFGIFKICQVWAELELFEVQKRIEYANLRGGPKPPENLRFASSFMSKELHEETTKLYIKAARQKQGSSVDPDVQVGNHIFDTIVVHDSGNNLTSGWARRSFQPLWWLRQGCGLLPRRSLRQTYRCSAVEQVILQVVIHCHLYRPLSDRLGATLANGNRSEEAVSAYHTALRYYHHSSSRYSLQCITQAQSWVHKVQI